MLHTDYSNHPECPMRIKSIYDYLKDNGYLEEMTELEIVESITEIDENGKCRYPAFREVHTQQEIANVVNTSNKLGKRKVDN